MLGHKHSEETKARMSAAMRGRPKTAEHRAKLRAAMTPERRELIRQSLVGREVSPETRARIGARVTKHGDARHAGMTTRLYRTWTNMRHRCSNPNNRSWKYYGGKGIAVCAEWDTFAVFKAWAAANGYRDGLSIDRSDPAKGYGPTNCAWVSRGENARMSNLTRIHDTALYVQSGRIGACSRWNIARGKPCVCGTHP